MIRQLPARIGYEYPARPRKQKVPCPHRQGVGYGTFCISGTCTPLERCNTLDFVPKLCAKVAAPLGIPAHIACWRCEFAAQKALTKAHWAVYGEGKALLRKCNNLLSSLRPTKCNGFSEGNGCIERISGKLLRTCVRKVVRTYAVILRNFFYIGMFFSTIV